MRRARLRRVNVFHCAATKSPQLPGIPFGWTTFPETTVRAVHESQRNEGSSYKASPKQRLTLLYIERPQSHPLNLDTSHCTKIRHFRAIAYICPRAENASRKSPEGRRGQPARQ